MKTIEVVTLFQALQDHGEDAVAFGKVFELGCTSDVEGIDIHAEGDKNVLTLTSEDPSVPSATLRLKKPYGTSPNTVVSYSLTAEGVEIKGSQTFDREGSLIHETGVERVLPDTSDGKERNVGTNDIGHAVAFQRWQQDVFVFLRGKMTDAEITSLGLTGPNQVTIPE